MPRVVSGNGRNRKQTNQFFFLRVFHFLGFGMAIACLLATLVFVLLQAYDQILR
jgi:hypothetical protein